MMQTLWSTPCFWILLCPHSERANEEIPEDGRSNKLPEGGEGEKLPEGGDDKRPAETPVGKLVVPCRKGILLFALNVIK